MLKTNLNLYQTRVWSTLKRQELIYKAVNPLKNKIENWLDPYIIANYKKKTGFDQPIPPVQLRRSTCGPRLEGYIDGGKAIGSTLKNNLQLTGKNISELSSVLDFGVGSGRVFHDFVKHKNLRMTGCDPDGRQIKWLSSNYPDAYFIQNDFDPPLDIADNTFDLIYAVSVFTHFSEQKQLAWLQELKRILRKNGVALLTILSEHAASQEDWLGNTANLYEALLANHFLFQVTPGTKKLSEIVNPVAKNENDMYGLTYHSHDYIYQCWSDYFQVKNIASGCIDNIQDLVVLQNH